jgi:NitT/TauT family transport system ATP-binding protein
MREIGARLLMPRCCRWSYLLEAHAVTVQYELPSTSTEIVALEDVSLRLARAESIAIVGPSGCGKSTLIRVLSGLYKPTAGEVRVSQKRIGGPSADIGVIFQQSTIFPWLTAVENVKFAVKRRKDGVEQEAAAELLELVGLADFASFLPHRLSGGMLQRLALARALAARPAVLLLDEPFSALDAMSRLQMHLLLEQVQTQRMFSILIVTHDFDEAITLADRVLLMTSRPGRIVGEVGGLLSRPRVATSGLRVEGFEAARNDLVRAAQDVFSL